MWYLLGCSVLSITSRFMVHLIIHLTRNYDVISDFLFDDRTGNFYSWSFLPYTIVFCFWLSEVMEFLALPSSFVPDFRIAMQWISVIYLQSIIKDIPISGSKMWSDGLQSWIALLSFELVCYSLQFENVLNAFYHQRTYNGITCNLHRKYM